MTIFSIAVLGLAIGAGSVMRANKTSYFSTIAVNLGQDNPANLTSCSTSCESPQPTYDGVAFIRTWTVQSNTPAPGVSQIDVQTEWTDYITHSVTISSAVLN